MHSDSKYQHGGTPRLDFARLSLPDRPVLDFSVSLNPLGPPAVVREKWTAMLEAVEGYPSVEGDGIGHYYRERFGISHSNLLAGNGSTEMIYLVPRVLRFRRVAVITPSYHDYERASKLAGADVKRCPILPENRFSFPDMNELIEVLKDSDALWVGRPNNPTGTLFPKGILLELAARFPDKWFIVDEAFIQFVDQWEENSLLTLQPRPNILVMHSLTKFYGLAGLRLGGIVGAEKTISRLRSAKEPWTVNGIADKIAPLLTGCIGYEKETRSLVTLERKRVFQRLEELHGITPFSSSANFILCQWYRTGNLDDLMGRLLAGGAYVRDSRNFLGLENNFFRVGLRAEMENDQLLALMDSRV